MVKDLGMIAFGKVKQLEKRVKELEDKIKDTEVKEQVRVSYIRGVEESDKPIFYPSVT